MHIIQRSFREVQNIDALIPPTEVKVQFSYLAPQFIHSIRDHLVNCHGSIRPSDSNPATLYMQADDVTASSASTSVAAPSSPSVIRSTVTRQDVARQLSSSTDPNASFFTQLSSNPFFTAGFGLAGLGAVAAVGQRGLRRAASLIRSRLLVDVELTIKDDSYPWFLLWMTQHHRRQLIASTTVAASGQNAAKQPLLDRVLSKLIPRMRHLALETSKQELPNGSIHTHFDLVPGPGQHFIRYGSAIVHVNRQRDSSRMEMLGSGNRPFETTTLTTLYTHRNVFGKIFAEAHALAQESVEGKTIIWQARTSAWEKFGHPRSKRPLDSVVLDKGVKEHILRDIEDFIGSAKWYADRGVPYRRGYLLYGPPGTGKSSFIQALAGHLDYGIAIVNLSERGLTDDRLNHLLTIIPKRTLVLLEDVDAAYSNRRQVDSDGYSGANVTFSGLLNALDGVASAEERILFLTTNHIERLDEALVRPGRVDMTVRLDNATVWQIDKLWDRFYLHDTRSKDSEGLEAEDMHIRKQKFMENLVACKAVSDLKERTISTVSTAALQGLFLYNKDNPDGAIAMAAQLGPGTRANAPLDMEKSV